MEAAGHPSPHHHTRWRRWALALVLIAAIVGVALHFGQIEQFANIIRGAEPAWLIAAVGLQGLTYLFVATGWRLVLGKAGSDVPLGTLFKLALAKLFTDQAVPAAGMGGNLLIIDRLIALGVRRGHAAAALMVSAIGYYAGLALLVLVALLLLWLHHKATPVLVGTVAIFLLVAFAIPAAWVWLSRRGARPLPRRLERIQALRSLAATVSEAPPALLCDTNLIARVGLLNALVFLADAATLSVCLLAIGQPASIAASYVALIVAQMAFLIGLVPFGLGTFEGACTGTLHLLGIAFEPALTATLLLRGFTLWLPMLPGMLIVRRMGRKGRARAGQG